MFLQCSGSEGASLFQLPLQTFRTVNDNRGTVWISDTELPDKVNSLCCTHWKLDCVKEFFSKAAPTLESLQLVLKTKQRVQQSTNFLPSHMVGRLWHRQSKLTLKHPVADINRTSAVMVICSN